MRGGCAGGDKTAIRKLEGGFRGVPLMSFSHLRSVSAVNFMRLVCLCVCVFFFCFCGNLGVNPFPSIHVPIRIDTHFHAPFHVQSPNVFGHVLIYLFTHACTHPYGVPRVYNR